MSNTYVVTDCSFQLCVCVCARRVCEMKETYEKSDDEKDQMQLALRHASTSLLIGIKWYLQDHRSTHVLFGSPIQFDIKNRNHSNMFLNHCDHDKLEKDGGIRSELYHIVIHQDLRAGHNFGA